jgi:hypothetical protein
MTALNEMIAAMHAGTVAGYDFERLCVDAAGHVMSFTGSELTGQLRADAMADTARGMDFRNTVRAVMLAMLTQQGEQEAKTAARGNYPPAGTEERRKIIYLERGGEVLVRLREESQ